MLKVKLVRLLRLKMTRFELASPLVTYAALLRQNFFRPRMKFYQTTFKWARRCECAPRDQYVDGEMRLQVRLGRWSRYNSRMLSWWGFLRNPNGNLATQGWHLIFFQKKGGRSAAVFLGVILYHDNPLKIWVNFQRFWANSLVARIVSGSLLSSMAIADTTSYRYLAGCFIFFMIRLLFWTGVKGDDTPTRFCCRCFCIQRECLYDAHFCFPLYEPASSPQRTSPSYRIHLTFPKIFLVS